MTIEALTGFGDAFLPQIHEARGHPGQIASAAHVRALLRRQRVHRRKPGHGPGPPAAAGCVLVALRAAGPRRGPGHPAVRARRGRARDRRRDRQSSDLHGPAELASAQGPLRRQLPCGVPGLRVGLHGDRRHRDRQHRRAAFCSVSTMGRSTGACPTCSSHPGTSAWTAAICSPSTSRRHWSPTARPSPTPTASTRSRPVPTRRITFRWRTMPAGMRGRWSRTSRVLSGSNWSWQRRHSSCGSLHPARRARRSRLSPRLCSISSAPRRPRMGVGIDHLTRDVVMYPRVRAAPDLVRSGAVLATVASVLSEGDLA